MLDHVLRDDRVEASAWIGGVRSFTGVRVVAVCIDEALLLQILITTAMLTSSLVTSDQIVFIMQMQTTQ